jgi:hypothetical protein
VNINRLSGSAFTYANFVKALMDKKEDVFYKYDDGSF